MGVDRGYKGDKAGQGYGRSLPKRKQCPECGKKGVFGPTATAVGLLRECQYCRATWSSELSWDLAKAAYEKRCGAASTEFAAQEAGA